MEFLTGPIAGTGLVAYDAIFFCLAAAMAAGCAYEWRSRRLPNWISLPALLVVLAWRAAIGDRVESAIVLGIAWGYFFWAWRRGFIGAGDAKGMMVLSGLWPSWWVTVLFVGGWGLATAALYSLWALGARLRGPGAIGSWWSMIRALPAHAAAPGAALPRRDLLLIPGVIGAVLFYLAFGRRWILG